jgi:hypothetical protein
MEGTLEGFKMSFIKTFVSRVEGIPCQIGVMTYERHAPMPAERAHSDIEFYGYTETDYVVLDRRGRPAPWLQEKLKDDDYIVQEIIDEMETPPCDY